MIAVEWVSFWVGWVGGSLAICLGEFALLVVQNRKKGK